MVCRSLWAIEERALGYGGYRVRRGGELAHCRCYVRGSTSLSALIAAARRRWTIEEFFAAAMGSGCRLC